MLTVAPLPVAAGPRAPQELPQSQHLLTPPSGSSEHAKLRDELHNCPGLDQVDYGHPLAIAACLDDAKTVAHAVEVLKKARQIEDTNRHGPRAESNVRRRVVLMSAFFWKERRVPTATLTDQAPFDQALLELLEAFKKTFFEKHTGTERVLFSHISKAGGTSFHGLAKANHKEMPTWNRWRRQGGWFKGDGPVWCCDEPIERSCEDHINMMGDNRLTLQERYLDANGGKDKPQLCDELVYAVMLRNPVDRLMSHLNELAAHYLSLAQPDNQLVNRLGDVIEAGCTNASMVVEALCLDATSEGAKRQAFIKKLGQTICGIASNYMTRSMLGTATFGAGVYQTHFKDTLVEDRADLAIAVLESFSVVLLLEESAEDQSQLDLFKLTLGFDQADLANHHERPTTINSRRFVPESLSPEQRWRLEQLNEADLKLYERAKMIFRQDMFFYSFAAGRNISVPSWTQAG